MFRCASRLFTSPRRVATARYFHQVTADFINCDSKGKPVSTKVSINIGNPEESYVQVDREIGWAFRAGSLHTSHTSPSTNVEDKCKLTFFHDTQHFGLASSPYPRLVIPRNLPRQSNSDTSPATIYLDGIMHEIVLDGTFDAQFAEYASSTYQNLKPALDMLKDM